MSAGRTKIFGMELGLDPKVVVLALIVIAGIIYYFTSGPEPTGAGASGSQPGPSVAAGPAANMSLAGRAAVARRARALRDDRNLKLVAVDGSRGDIDPTLRLRLLERVRSVPPAAGLRNLFEVGAAAPENLPAVPKNPPKIIPQPPPDAAVAAAPPPPVFNIPLRYYGFVKPSGHAVDGSRGFFMDGDNILVGGEGDVLEKHFLIVALTPNMARLEDMDAKQGQDLQVTPEAQPAAQ